MLVVIMSDHCAFSSSCWWGVNLLYRHMSTEIITKSGSCVSARKGMNNPGDYCSTSGEHGCMVSSWLDFSALLLWTLQSNLILCGYVVHMCAICHWNRLFREVVADQVCQSSRSIYTMISVMWLIVRSSCEGQGVGLGESYGSFPTWDILWF